MDTSNHSWNAGDRPTLRVTPAGMELLAYLDYVTVHNFVSLAPTDTAVPEPEQPVDPGDQQWDDMPKAHVQTPEETAWAIRQLMDAGATFPNFQVPEAPPEKYDDERNVHQDDDDDPYDDNIIPPLPLNGSDDMDDDDDDYGEHSPEED